MSLSRWPFLASAAALAVTAGVALTAAAATGDKAVSDRAASDPATPAVQVDAPFARVEAGKRQHVEAPYTSVQVDANGGSVRVRAPFANVDVTW
jgi:hypothetical protein